VGAEDQRHVVRDEKELTVHVIEHAPKVVVERKRAGEGGGSPWHREKLRDAARV